MCILSTPPRNGPSMPLRQPLGDSYCMTDFCSLSRPKDLRPNPKSLTGGLSRLWHGVMVDSDIGLPMVNVFGWIDSRGDIR
jgi:hypothetical protein